jgi:hypothetical protein
MQMIASGQNSYWAWAYSLSIFKGFKISKQAIFYRMNAAWVSTVKSLLAKTVSNQACKKLKSDLFKSFCNVWIQDSTCIQLPEALLKKYKGNVASGKQRSVAKLTIVMNALSGVCPFMEWGSFTQSEQSLSDIILKVARTGDLIIRDMGYFVLRVFTELDGAGIFFLSRWKYRTGIFDVQNGNEIHLLKLLRGKTFLDIEVLCGKDERIKVRLIAVKLSSEQREQRIRKAKAQERGKTNHSNEYYALLGYIIFITNVKKSVWNYRQVAEAYRIRWNIEIVFKSWKSGLNIRQLIPHEQQHLVRTESILYLMLLYISWFLTLIYIPLRFECQKKGKHLSIIQSAKWMIINLLKVIAQNNAIDTYKEIIAFCCHDKRRQTNACQRLLGTKNHLLT